MKNIYIVSIKILCLLICYVISSYTGKFNRDKFCQAFASIRFVFLTELICCNFNEAERWLPIKKMLICCIEFSWKMLCWLLLRHLEQKRSWSWSSSNCKHDWKLPWETKMRWGYLIYQLICCHWIAVVCWDLMCNSVLFATMQKWSSNSVSVWFKDSLLPSQMTSLCLLGWYLSAMPDDISVTAQMTSQCHLRISLLVDYHI